MECFRWVQQARLQGRVVADSETSPCDGVKCQGILARSSSRSVMQIRKLHWLTTASAVSQCFWLGLSCVITSTGHAGFSHLPDVFELCGWETNVAVPALPCVDICTSPCALFGWWHTDFLWICHVGGLLERR